MKILFTSDLHDNYSIKFKLQEFLKYNEIDVSVVCGDIFGKMTGYINTLEKLKEKQKSDYEDFKTRFPNTYYILGNDDWIEGDINDPYYIKDKLINIDSINFYGFEGVLKTPFNTNREFTENELYLKLKDIPKVENLIVVAHEPAYMCNDLVVTGEHVGSKYVRNYIEFQQPLIWVSGHIHECFGINKVDNTSVLNVSSDISCDTLRLLIYDTDKKEFERVIL